MEISIFHKQKLPAASNAVWSKKINKSDTFFTTTSNAVGSMRINKSDTFFCFCFMTDKAPYKILLRCRLRI